MRFARLIFWLALTMLIPTIAGAMLEISELYHIAVPDNISKIDYIDISGDGTRDIIVYTLGDLAQIYDGRNGALVKALGGINWYPTTAYQDMNNDGHLDLIFSNAHQVKIYNLEDSLISWESPSLQEDFVFSVGDRNSDGFQDIICAYKYPFREGMTLDTVWVELYDGPEYQLSGSYAINVVGSHSEWGTPGGYYYSEQDYRESPKSILFTELSSSDDLVPVILLFTRWNYNCYTEQYGLFQDESRTSGKIHYINPINFENSVGWFANLISYEQVSNEYQTELYAVGEYYNVSDGYGFPRFFNTTKSIACVRASGIVSSRAIWSYRNPYEIQGYNWLGYLLGDFDYTNPALEVSFFIRDTLTAVCLEDTIPLWSTTYNYNQSNTRFILHSDSLFSNPQIMAGNPLSTYDGTDGHLTGIFPNQQYNINNVVDLSNDGEDEVITVYSRTIYINHITGEPEVGIDGQNGSQLPNSIKISSYPNPFNAQTTISYSLAQSGPVSISIYNLLGQKVATIFDGPQQAGEHSIIWDASGLTSGLYFARLEAGEKSQSARLVLLK